MDIRQRARWRQPTAGLSDRASTRDTWGPCLWSSERKETPDIFCRHATVPVGVCEAAIANVAQASTLGGGAPVVVKRIAVPIPVHIAGLPG